MSVSTVTVTDTHSIGDPRGGNLKIVSATVVFSGSYSTAGELASPSWEAALGLDRIFSMSGSVGEGGPPPTLFLLAFWNPVNFKVQLATSAGAAPASLAEKTAAAYGTAPTGQFTFIGR